jgi:hypothetical protein
MELISKGVLKHINRYGETYIFAELDTGNVRWSGPFKHSRFSHENDYSEAWNRYLEGEYYRNKLNFPDFVKEMHNPVYNAEGKWVKNSDISEKYSQFVGSNTNIISMIDPSGGPYMAIGSKIFDKEIKNFIPTEYGYEIVIDND